MSAVRLSQYVSGRPYHFQHAHVAKLANAPDQESGGGNTLQVRSLPCVLYFYIIPRAESLFKIQNQMECVLYYYFNLRPADHL